jgi:hypothetical protein
LKKGYGLAAFNIFVLFLFTILTYSGKQKNKPYRMPRKANGIFITEVRMRVAFQKPDIDNGMEIDARGIWRSGLGSVK